MQLDIGQFLKVSPQTKLQHSNIILRAFGGELIKPVYETTVAVKYEDQSRDENEIKRLVDMEISELIEKSDWATPIVPVIKPDESVRICGDFKVTLNPVLEDINYPLPRMEDIFAKHLDEKFFFEK
ncbi:hypothetical protein AVEN_76067-1 [Araneus ventricosus]|uniref:Uncharacterized protein n=1 Tax=Araneus ventricosus TaxID=182803 RepID=A0A4Y2WMD0_ARAVE|nr:hypothetical protein AVEN_76067-1 [Araneus ventricosus]